VGIGLVAFSARAENGERGPVSLGSSTGPRVSVRVRASRGPTEREVAGHVALTLPLDRFAAPRVVSAGSASEPEGEAEPETRAPPSAEHEKEVSPASEERLPLSLGAFLGLARDTVRRALEVAGASEQVERLESLSSRARSSAVLPVLRLRAARSDDHALRLAPTHDDPYRYTLAGGTDLLLEATATWDLARLVFANEEVPIARLRAERDKARSALVERILDRLFTFRRTLAKVLDPATPPEQALKAELELIDAITALDVVTDGAFSERLRALGFSFTGSGIVEPAAERAAPGARAVEEPVSDGRAHGFALSTPRDVGRNQEQSPEPPTARSRAKGVSLTSLH